MSRTTGAQLRDEGVERVLSPEVEWRQWYGALITEWFAGREEGFRFTGETLRLIARDKGLPEPHHYNAWSGAAAALIRPWIREKKIFVTGRYVHATTKSTHAHALREYEKMVPRRYQFAPDTRQFAMEGL